MESTGSEGLVDARQIAMLPSYAMAADRDKLTPKPVPLHVRKQTAGPVEEERARQRKIAELEHELERVRGGGIVQDEIPDAEARTPVNMDPFGRLEFRQRRNSVQLQNVITQVGTIATEVAKLEARHENLDEKIDQILKVEIDDRRARDQDRLAREQRAEAARIDLERAKTAAELEEKKQIAELRKTTAGYRTRILLQVIVTMGALLGAYFAGRGG